MFTAVCRLFGVCRRLLYSPWWSASIWMIAAAFSLVTRARSWNQTQRHCISIYVVINTNQSSERSLHMGEMICKQWAQRTVEPLQWSCYLQNPTECANEKITSANNVLIATLFHDFYTWDFTQIDFHPVQRNSLPLQRCSYTRWFLQLYVDWSDVHLVHSYRCADKPAMYVQNDCIHWQPRDLSGPDCAAHSVGDQKTNKWAGAISHCASEKDKVGTALQFNGYQCVTMPPVQNDTLGCRHYINGLEAKHQCAWQISRADRFLGKGVLLWAALGESTMRWIAKSAGLLRDVNWEAVVDSWQKRCKYSDGQL